MKDRKKLILTIILITTILVITLGVTYAAFVYRENTNNQQLVLGDIYMYYNETNQLSIDNMVPTNIANYTTYVVNPIMASQTLNELTNCVSINLSIDYDTGSDAESYCKGTGTAWGGITLQEELDEIQNLYIEHGFNYFETDGKQLLDLGIVILDGEDYVLNPVMKNQAINDNELTRCIDIHTNREKYFDEGSDAKSFCQGTGTSHGFTIQEELDMIQQNVKEEGYDFLNSYGGYGFELLHNGIIITKVENLPYFEFTVSGKNEYNEKDIYYEVILNHGDTPDDKLETNRIKDSSLRFRLAKVNNDNTETKLFNERKYSDVANKTIWVETIKANTDDEISNKYRLYMWIDEDVTICGGEITSGCDYYTSGDTNNWNDVFASVKVGVKGDFNEKELPLEPTDESCFETQIVPIYVHNTNMTEEEINKCVTIFRDEMMTSIGYDETYENFCQGTGTIYGKTFQQYLDNDDYFSQNNLIYLEENNIIILNGSAVEITAYDSSCGNEVVIPESINGYDKIKIGRLAFSGAGLRNVVFSNSVISIDRAFNKGNYLTNVTIPDSVTYLECNAFADGVIINKSDDLVCSMMPG